MFSQLNREFHAAIRRNDIVDVRRCLDEGANPKQVDGMGFTPLFNAVTNSKDWFDVFGLLVSRGASISQSNLNQRYNTPLFGNCRGGSPKSLSLVLDLGARVDQWGASDPQVQEHPRGTGLVVPLGLTSHHRRFELTKVLLDRDADVDLGFQGGASPLCIACRQAIDVSDVSVLLSHGAVIDRNVCRAILNNGGASTLVKHSLLELMAMLTHHYPAYFAWSHVDCFAVDAGVLVQAELLWSERRANLLARRMLRIRLHVVGPRADHAGSARRRVFDCRPLARHLVEFLSGPLPPRVFPF